MADDVNTNPFYQEDDDLIEHEVERSAPERHSVSEQIELTWDSVAVKLLKDKLILTALELHTELVEAGRELPRLRDYFSNPGNFERTKEDSPPTTLARTSSIQTFDSLDFARYSDDGERQVDERVAVLEFELRKAQDTIKSLRASLTRQTENEHIMPEQKDEEKVFPGMEEAMKPLEKRALNFLVNQYLLQINNKITSVTFSEENEDQDFESWDDVGLNVAQPPDILHLYRDYNNHSVPQTNMNDAGCQVDGLQTTEALQEEITLLKRQLKQKMIEMEELLLNREKEMLVRQRGVAEGSEADDIIKPSGHEGQGSSPPWPYKYDDQSIGVCDHDENEICDNCEPVQTLGRQQKSQSLYRIEYTDIPDEKSDNNSLELPTEDITSDRNSIGPPSDDGTVLREKESKLDFSDRSEDGDLNGLGSDRPRSCSSESVDTVKQVTTEADQDLYYTENTKANKVTKMSKDNVRREDTQGQRQDKLDENGCKKDSSKLNAYEQSISDRLGKTGADILVYEGPKDEHEHSGLLGSSAAQDSNTDHNQSHNDDMTDIPSDDLQKENNKLSHDTVWIEERYQGRTMSAPFRKALMDVCFSVTMDNRIVFEVSKIVDADEEKVINMLARCLPHIVPNVLLAKREELIPLIVCTAMLHKDDKERDRLLNILFNLIKKPDEEQRQMILTGCVAYAQHVGPDRLEAELLPQCWEQISHKYMERRLLVAEACGALASYLPNTILSSLVVSMLQQMLFDDKEAEVREAAVRSLGLLFGVIQDSDKYTQGVDLLRTALKDPADRVVTSAQQVLLPSLALWAYQLGKLEHSLLHSLLRDLEELVKSAIATQKSVASLNEGRFLLNVTTLQVLIPFLYISVIESGPYRVKVEEIMSTVENIEVTRFPKPSSRLTDLSVILGDSRRLAALVHLFEDHISQEWFEPWDSLNWAVNNLVPRLLEVVMGAAVSFPRIISSLACCFLSLSCTFGETFVDKKVKPRFIDVLLMGEDHVDDSQSSFTPNTTPLTTCVVPVYARGVLSAFNTEEDRKQLTQFLREALFCLSIYQSPKDSLRMAFLDLSTSPGYHDLLLNVLWDGVVHSSPLVRATSARMFEILVHAVSEAVASTRIVPALVTLGNDPEIIVRIATIPAMGTIIETITAREMLDRVYMQLQTFLDDPIYRDEHSLHIELIGTFARVGPNAEPKFRDEFVLPRLAVMALENNNVADEKMKREVAIQLFEAYSAMSCCFINDQLLQEAMLPGLRCLRQDMSQTAPEHEEVVNSMIRDYESKMETTRPADRTGSFTVSSPAQSEDMKARMMSRLKESTSKANIGSLFNRKK